MLIPENKFKKQLSVLVSCVFLLSGITAASGAVLNYYGVTYELGVS